MSEEEHLLARINELAAQINQRKNQDAPQQSTNYPQPSTSAYQPVSSYPYGRKSNCITYARGQGFHHRSLNLNNHEKPHQGFTPPRGNEQAGLHEENWNVGRRGVAKYGRGAKAWISEDALRRKLERRKHFANSVHAAVNDAAAPHGMAESVSPPVAYITIEDIQFQVVNAGSKLLRVTDTADFAKATPKEAKVSGVTFKRSKNGNLVRAAAHQRFSQHDGKRRLCRQYTSTGTLILSVDMLQTFSEIRFSVRGRRRCPRGDKCFGIHDINRTAICQSVLRGVQCSAGDDCDLSHKSSPEVAPTCLHFQRGKCIKHSCPYSHAPVIPSDPLCRDFAYLGYCDRGSNCGQRHLRECPDYATSSGCRSKHCALPHVDRASQMRRNAANNSGNLSEMVVDGTSSPEETDDDITGTAIESNDSEERDKIYGSHNYYGLPQQQDYVGLS